MHYDAIIIGAGMSGLAAGIRLAHFDKSVCIVEQHEQFGGLNSFYKLGSRRFDVGLHALTNFVPRGVKNTPLPKLLRQLRIPRDSLELCEQFHSEIRFPDCALRFSNDIELLQSDVAERFPREADAFRALADEVGEYDDGQLDITTRSARAVLSERIGDPLLIEMLFCPLLYYGSAVENDIEFTQFVTMFKALFLQGFCRPRDGVRTIVTALVKRFRTSGGKVRMNCGVRRIETDGKQVTGVTLENGETLTADTVISSAGYFETMRLCSDTVAPPPSADLGRMSFIESISCLDCKPADIGIDATIVFFNDGERFHYAPPDDLADTRSGVFCCSNNFEHHDHLEEGIVRLTSIANYDRWRALDEETYRAEKNRWYDRTIDRARKFIPEFRDHVVFRDMFTPRTIHHFTRHYNGAVYGAPSKRRDGRTRLQNLFICGTDQGLVGVVGAILSGIWMANLHVLQAEV